MEKYILYVLYILFASINIKQIHCGVFDNLEDIIKVYGNEPDFKFARRLDPTKKNPCEDMIVVSYINPNIIKCKGLYMDSLNKYKVTVNNSIVFKESDIYSTFSGEFFVLYTDFENNDVDFTFNKYLTYFFNVTIIDSRERCICSLLIERNQTEMMPNNITENIIEDYNDYFNENNSNNIIMNTPTTTVTTTTNPEVFSFALQSYEMQMIILGVLSLIIIIIICIVVGVSCRNSKRGKYVVNKTVI